MGWWSICRADEEMRPQVRKWTGNARQLLRWMREAGDRLCWRRESLRASGDSTDGGGGPGEHSWRGGAERQTVRIADGNHWCWLYWTVYKCSGAGEGKMLTAAIQEECFEVVAHLSRQLQTPTYSWPEPGVWVRLHYAVLAICAAPSVSSRRVFL